MAKTSTDLLEMILRECAGTGTQPWYPSVYAQETGVPREALDGSLDDLRLGGLIRLTDWVQGRGQGYVLTPEGKEVVESPRLLGRLRANGVPSRTPPPVAANARRASELPTPWERGEEVRAALLAPATPQVTLVLLFLNLMVFAAGYVLAAQSQIPLTEFAEGTGQRVLEILHKTGAIKRVDIMENQWWRLLSCCFVHIGFLHLLVNMYSLYVVGPLLERMWGKWRFVLLYLISGLVGSCCMVVYSVPNFLGAGASGALWGIMASMATWIFFNRSHLPRQLVAAWKRQLLLVFVLNVLITFSIPSISASAHFGGGIAGLIVAVPLHYVRSGHGWLRWLAAAAVALLPLASLAALEYTIAPERALEEVKSAHNEEIRVFNDYVDRLVLTKASERRDHPDAPEAARKAREIHQRMKEIAEHLPSAGLFRDPAQVELLQAAHKYVEAAGQFYQTFERSLDPRAAWNDQNDQDEQTLGQQFTELIKQRRTFRELASPH